MTDQPPPSEGQPPPTGSINLSGLPRRAFAETRTHGPRDDPHVQWGGRAVRVTSEAELKQIPPNAFRISRSEALRIAKRIRDRPENSDHATFEEQWLIGAGVSTALSSIFIINAVRHRFKLGRHHARGIHYVFGSIFPVIYTPYLHFPTVVEPALLKEDCKECLSVRGGLIQVAGGVVWSAATGVLGGFYYARRYFTVPLPPIGLKYAPEFAKIIHAVFQGRAFHVLCHVGLQFVVGYTGARHFWHLGQNLDVADQVYAMKTEQMGRDGRSGLQFIPLQSVVAKPTGTFVTATERDAVVNQVDSEIADDSGSDTEDSDETKDSQELKPMPL